MGRVAGCRTSIDVDLCFVVYIHIRMPMCIHMMQASLSFSILYGLPHRADMDACITYMYIHDM